MNNEEIRTHIRLPFLCAFLILAVLAFFAFLPHPSPVRRGTDGAGAPRPADPAVAARAYVVRFAGNPAPILKRREGKRMAPASLTKLMTAVIAREELGAGDRVTFSRDAKNAEQKISSARPGEAFLRDDAIRMALIASANDAALALAEAAGKKKQGGGFTENINRFTRLMNEKAKWLGMRDTHFENPTGLDADGHYTSAQDLARISEYVFGAHPGLWEISRTAEMVVYSDRGAPHAIQTTNELLYEFPALQGGKTGFTDRAQGALILLYPVRSKSPQATAVPPTVERTSHGAYPVRPRATAIIVILGSPDRFGDGRKIIHWLEANCLASRGDLGERPCEP